MNGKSVADCWTLYQEHLATTVQAHENNRYWGRLQWFAGHDAQALTPQEVRRYIKERNVQQATINRELALLRACLRHAEREGLIERAPIIKGLLPPRTKVHALTHQQAAALVHAADRRNVWYERVYVRLALGTAQRPEAVMGLRWDQVHAEAIDFRLTGDLIHRMKGRAIVPLNEMTVYALELARQFEFGSYVMHDSGDRMDNPRRLIKRLGNLAKVEVSPHVLRHTAASLLLQGGEDLLRVSRLLAHASTKITEQVYFQHPPEWLKATTGKLVF